MMTRELSHRQTQRADGGSWAANPPGAEQGGAGTVWPNCQLAQCRLSGGSVWQIYARTSKLNTLRQEIIQSRRQRKIAIKLSTRGSPRAERTGAATTMREDVRAFKRELILNTAIDIFFDKGYQSSTVDDIAAAMSVTKAVVYYNFNSKEEVLENIIDRTMALTHESIDRGIKMGKTPAQKLALVCYFYAAHILDHQKMIGVYFREERSFSAALRRRTTILEKSVDEKVSAVLDAGTISGEFRKGDTRLMAITITGMISMAFHWYRESGRVSREGICWHFAEQAVRLVGFDGDLGLDRAAFKLVPEND